MSSSEARANMARAGTMQVTSKEGMTYLQKNLPNHWKHINQLKVHFAEENVAKNQGTSTAGKKRSASYDSKSKKNQKPAAKKPRLTKTRTMAATTQESALLLGGEVFGDTREMTKKKKMAAAATRKAKTNSKKTQSKKMKPAKQAVVKAIKSKAKKSKTQKKVKKPSLKKANTMVKTAKEGKAFIKRDGTKLPSKRRGQSC